MTLIPVSDLDNDNRVRCLAAGWLALDPKSGVYLRRSPGNPADYILSTPGKTAAVITAGSDQEAITKANRGRA